MNKFLIAPLDWGLGHATRCIPIIDELLKNEQEVVLSATGGAFQLLKQRYPEITFIDIPSYQIHYSKSGNMAFSMISQANKILKGISLERQVLNELVNAHGITHVISDNRYGLYSPKTYNIFMTHQLNIQAPGILKLFKPFLDHKLNNMLNKFDEIWVPDNTNESSLAGVLSVTNMKVPVNYIGPLSRFSKMSINPKIKYEIIAMVSGPEPQRELFHELLLKQMKQSEKKCLLVSGLPNSEYNSSVTDNITLKNHISDEEFMECLHPETLFIARCGYSTIMDLATIKHFKTILVPTPGQTEQEYLATYMNRNYNVSIQSQHEINLTTEVQKSNWPQPAGEFKSFIKKISGTGGHNK